jgi:hypothetical protein
VEDEYDGRNINAFCPRGSKEAEIACKNACDKDRKAAEWMAPFYCYFVDLGHNHQAVRFSVAVRCSPEAQFIHPTPCSI